MEIILLVLVIVQIIFTVAALMFFWDGDKPNRTFRPTCEFDCKNESAKLEAMRKISLTRPLSEKTRPEKMSEIIGQENGIKALRAVFCGKNPQHVIIYGPAGVGKTAAARIVLEEAKKNPMSPFKDNAKFVEIDATTLRFDERSIADPLIGSVHDPIYQGAGAYGQAGIPQPKEGAVTKAHGGVLFIDEIGELNPVQMNKLLKVLEDRKVHLESAYYSSDNKMIPEYIHDIFKNGFPADFRLIGATTRSPEDIPEALRSRCCEIFFDGLKSEHIKKIAVNAAKSTGMDYEKEAVDRITDFSKNGRDTVNIIQTAASLAILENREKITLEDINWVMKSGRYQPIPKGETSDSDHVGMVNGLGVTPDGRGMLLKIEAAVYDGTGNVEVTGIIEEEEFKNGSITRKRRSTASASVKNALSALKNLGINNDKFDIHVNFPGGMPVDGPSAGCAIFSALFSAFKNEQCDPRCAMTGEIDIFGNVLPVGGVEAKIDAAIEAGVKTVFVPAANADNMFDEKDANIVYVDNVEKIIDRAFKENVNKIRTEKTA
ncbi:MAG: ATP-dependent protease LonB [Clostridia bacterium]|jgi:Lon-like ATP-dependent protease|nr:ATP-dependent protease LonB [Clostridia bacterium]